MGSKGNQPSLSPPPAVEQVPSIEMPTLESLASEKAELERQLSESRSENERLRRLNTALLQREEFGKSIVGDKEAAEAALSAKEAELNSLRIQHSELSGRVQGIEATAKEAMEKWVTKAEKLDKVVEELGEDSVNAVVGATEQGKGAHKVHLILMEKLFIKPLRDAAEAKEKAAKEREMEES